METAAIPFTWRAFGDSLQPGGRHPYEGYPAGPHPGPRVYGKVTVDRRHLYALNPGNLVRLHPAVAEDERIPEYQLLDDGERSLARSRRGRRLTPLGWTKVEGCVLLYIDDRTALPGRMCAYLLGCEPERGIVWQCPAEGPPGVQDPVAIYREAEPEVPISYVMPVIAGSAPEWKDLSPMRAH